MNKIISFCLWGDTPLYTKGAIRNAELAKVIYPDWVCRFYIPKDKSNMTACMHPSHHSGDNSIITIKAVPAIIIEALKEQEAEIIRIEDDGSWKSMLWRFYAADDADIVIFRDCDSRLTYREKAAVDEWVNSDKKVHMMRDHPWQCAPIQAGMWGIKKGILNNFTEIINAYLKTKNSKVGYYQIDQDFLIPLNKYLVQFMMSHSSYSNSSQSTIPFPTQRYKQQFIGQPYDEMGKALITLDGKTNAKMINEFFELDNESEVILNKN